MCFQKEISASWFFLAKDYSSEDYFAKKIAI